MIALDNFPFFVAQIMCPVVLLTHKIVIGNCEHNHKSSFRFVEKSFRKDFFRSQNVQTGEKNYIHCIFFVRGWNLSASWGRS